MTTNPDQQLREELDRFEWTEPELTIGGECIGDYPGYLASWLSEAGREALTQFIHAKQKESREEIRDLIAKEIGKDANTPLGERLNSYQTLVKISDKIAELNQGKENNE